MDEAGDSAVALHNNFRRALSVREFRKLWLAELLSVAGDQLARVALAVLVFDRTGSSALTALTYALTFLPALVGGIFFAGLADRYPRRTVLIVTDLIRAALAASLAIPGMPLPLLWISVFVLAAAGGPFKAAQLALLPQVLGDDLYQAGLALRTITAQGAQLAGFLSGGLVLTVLSPEAVLGANAATFIGSAVMIRVGVQRRGAPVGAAARQVRRASAGFAALHGRRGPVALVGFIWLAGMTIAPEGLAAPYADGLGGGAFAVGLLMAADPVGSVLGAWVAGRRRERAQPATASLAILAIAAGAALIPAYTQPTLIVSAVCWALSGALTTMFLIQAQVLLTPQIPDDKRGSVLGLASSGLQMSQGVAVLGAGVLAGPVGVYRAVAAVGLATVLLGLALGWLAQPQGAATPRDRGLA